MGYNLKDKVIIVTGGAGLLGKSDLMGTVLYLLSDMSRYVNGQNIIVDDGASL